MQFNCGRVLEACIVLLEGRVYISEHPAAVASSTTSRLISEVRKHVSAQSDSLGFSAQCQMRSNDVSGKYTHGHGIRITYVNAVQRNCDMFIQLIKIILANVDSSD